MELWIRSQNKESLFKVQNVFYSTYYETRHFINTCAANNTHEGFILELGKYSTKERALEVLDEIQERLNFNVKFEIGAYVYEMLKE